MTRAVAIINPIAGVRRAGSLERATALAMRALSDAGFPDPAVLVTEGPGDAYRMACQARDGGASLVVAWGGDGTVNGVASALARTDVPLGIVPAGSGNGLAHELGLPRDPGQALVIAARGRVRRIDAGEVAGSLFFNVAGVGLDAAVAARLAAPGVRRGLSGYVLAASRVWPVYQAQHYTIGYNGSTWSGRALLVAFANSRQYGSGAQIAPQAGLDDGLLDVVTVEAQAAAVLLCRLPAFFRGTLKPTSRLHMGRFTTLELRGGQAIDFHVDGEPRRGGRVLPVQVHAGVLGVKVPG